MTHTKWVQYILYFMGNILHLHCYFVCKHVEKDFFSFILPNETYVQRSIFPNSTWQKGAVTGQEGVCLSSQNSGASGKKNGHFGVILDTMWVQGQFREEEKMESGRMREGEWQGKEKRDTQREGRRLEEGKRMERKKREKESEWVQESETQGKEGERIQGRNLWESVPPIKDSPWDLHFQSSLPLFSY